MLPFYNLSHCNRNPENNNGKIDKNLNRGNLVKVENNIKRESSNYIGDSISIDAGSTRVYISIDDIFPDGPFEFEDVDAKWNRLAIICENKGVVRGTQQAPPENYQTNYHHQTAANNQAFGGESSRSGTVMDKNSMVELNSNSTNNVKTTGYLNGNTKQHKKAHQVFSCQLCSKILQSQRNLENHIAKLHNGAKVRSSQSEESRDRPYECSVCEKRFYTKHTKNKHEKSQHGDCHLSYTRSVRENGFNTDTEINGHEQIHSEDSTILHKCSVCECEFDTESHRKAHEAIHCLNPRRPHRCSVCKKALCTNHYKKKHEKMHNVDRPRLFSCSLCEKKFRDERSVKRHQIVHSENRLRLAKCSMCDKTFYDKYAARRHEKTHQVEK